MATIASVVSLYSDGGSQRVALYRIPNVTSGDTVDVSTVGPIAFRKVQAALFFGGAQGAGVLAGVAGTVITFTSTGLANDTVTVMILGEA